MTTKKGKWKSSFMTYTSKDSAKVTNFLLVGDRPSKTRRWPIHKPLPIQIRHLFEHDITAKCPLSDLQISKLLKLEASIKFIGAANLRATTPARLPDQRLNIDLFLNMPFPSIKLPLELRT